MSTASEINLSNHSLVLLYDCLSKSDKKIINAFLYFYECKVYGAYKRIYPSIAKIASMAGCCTRTVDRFLEKHKTLFFEEIYWVRRSVSKKWMSNTYIFNQRFFNIMLQIKKLGFLQNWKAHRSQALEMHDTEREYKNSFKATNRTSKDSFNDDSILSNKSLKNTDLSYGSPRECRTKEMLHADTGTKGVPSNQSFSEEEKKSLKLMVDEGLSPKTATFLAKKFLFDVVFKARDYLHFKKKTSEIANMDAWFRNQCFFHSKN